MYDIDKYILLSYIVKYGEMEQMPEITHRYICLIAIKLYDINVNMS